MSVTSEDAVPGDYIDEDPADWDDERRFTLPPESAPARLDKALAVLLPEVSRSRLRRWIEDGAVTVNGRAVTAADARVGAGDRIAARPRPADAELAFRPEEGVEFEVIHADSDLIVIDKPAGLVVHPASGHWSGTLLNGLLWRFPELSRLPRAGIVHRLDRDTSGLLVVARSERAQLSLTEQLRERSLGRLYWAVCHGRAPVGGRLDRSIGRDPASRLRFACREGAGTRPAATRFLLCQYLVHDGHGYSWLICRLETGRTHQIRVHLSAAGLPLLGDPLYRGPGRSAPRAPAPLPRQALHACRLRLLHPADGAPREWCRPPPADLSELLDRLGFDRDCPLAAIAPDDRCWDELAGAGKS